MAESQRTSNQTRPRLLLAAAVLTIAAAVWGVSQVQRSAADRAFAESRAGHQMLAAMLDQETGLRGFALSRRDDFLEPFLRGERNFNDAADDARRNIDEDEHEAFREQINSARRWQGLAREEVQRLRVSGSAPLELSYVRVRKAAFDRFRRLNGEYQEQADARRRSDLAKAGMPSSAAAEKAAS